MAAGSAALAPRGLGRRRAAAGRPGATAAGHRRDPARGRQAEAGRPGAGPARAFPGAARGRGGAPAGLGRGRGHLAGRSDWVGPAGSAGGRGAPRAGAGRGGGPGGDSRPGHRGHPGAHACHRHAQPAGHPRLRRAIPGRGARRGHRLARAVADGAGAFCFDAGLGNGADSHLGHLRGLADTDRRRGLVVAGPAGADLAHRRVLRLGPADQGWQGAGPRRPQRGRGLRGRATRLRTRWRWCSR